MSSWGYARSVSLVSMSLLPLPDHAFLNDIHPMSFWLTFVLFVLVFLALFVTSNWRHMIRSCISDDIATVRHVSLSPMYVCNSIDRLLMSCNLCVRSSWPRDRDPSDAMMAGCATGGGARTVRMIKSFGYLLNPRTWASWSEICVRIDSASRKVNGAVQYAFSSALSHSDSFGQSHFMDKDKRVYDGCVIPQWTHFLRVFTILYTAWKRVLLSSFPQFCAFFVREQYFWACKADTTQCLETHVKKSNMIHWKVQFNMSHVSLTFLYISATCPAQ